MLFGIHTLDTAAAVLQRGGCKGTLQRMGGGRAVSIALMHTTTTTTAASLYTAAPVHTTTTTTAASLLPPLLRLLLCSSPQQLLLLLLLVLLLHGLFQAVKRPPLLDDAAAQTLQALFTRPLLFQGQLLGILHAAAQQRHALCAAYGLA